MKQIKSGIPSLLASLAGVALTIGSAGAATLTWTGGLGTGSNWYDAGNWAGGIVPAVYESGSTVHYLATTSSSDIIVFNSTTAINNYLPTNYINASTGGILNDGARLPQLQVLNGTIKLLGGGNTGFTGIGITSIAVGDGDMTNLAVVDTGLSDLNSGPDGLKTYIVNADGTLIFRGKIANWSYGADNDAQIQLNGGTALFNNIIVSDLTNDADDFVSFNTAGSTLTAKFGGTFVDLASVNAQIGGSGSFVSPNGLTLDAKDNSNGTFTVTALVPEPSAVLLGSLGFLALLRRRR